MSGRYTRVALLLVTAVAFSTSSPTVASPRSELRALQEHVEAVPTDQTDDPA